MSLLESRGILHFLGDASLWTYLWGRVPSRLVGRYPRPDTASVPATGDSSTSLSGWRREVGWVGSKWVCKDEGELDSGVVPVNRQSMSRIPGVMKNPREFYKLKLNKILVFLFSCIIVT